MKLTSGVVNPPLAEAKAIGFWCDSILDQQMLRTVVSRFFFSCLSFLVCGSAGSGEVAIARMNEFERD